jgi:hypothetical protein
MRTGAPAAVVFTTSEAQVLGIVRLRSHQRQDQLVVGLVEAGRVDNVGSLHRVHQVGSVTPEFCRQRQVREQRETPEPVRPAPSPC